MICGKSVFKLIRSGRRADLRSLWYHYRCVAAPFLTITTDTPAILFTAITTVTSMNPFEIPDLNGPMAPHWNNHDLDNPQPYLGPEWQGSLPSWDLREKDHFRPSLNQAVGRNPVPADFVSTGQGSGSEFIGVDPERDRDLRRTVQPFGGDDARTVYVQGDNRYAQPSGELHPHRGAEGRNRKLTIDLMKFRLASLHAPVQRQESPSTWEPIPKPPTTAERSRDLTN
jgi:hypothetical protein